MRSYAPSLLRAASLLLLMNAALALATPEVAATPTAGASNLTMDGAGSAQTRIVKIADLSVSTDDPQGFTLSITSGNLTKAGGSAIPFQVALVGDEAAAPASSAFTVASGGALLRTTSTAGALPLDLYIKYRAADLQDPGVYSASIGLDIIDN